MIVCGLDLSLTNTGIAVLTDGRPTLLRSVGHGGKNGASHAHRSRRIVSQSRAVMTTIHQAQMPHKMPCTCVSRMDTSKCLQHAVPRPDSYNPDLVVIEGPSYDSKFGHSFDRAGLWWGVYSSLLAKRIPIVVIPPTSLKIWTTGKGNASKQQMLEMVRFWWPGTPIPDDDRADALALATIGAFHLGDPVPFEVKDRHHSALEKVEWPVSA